MVSGSQMSQRSRRCDIKSESFIFVYDWMQRDLGLPRVNKPENPYMRERAYPDIDEFGVDEAFRGEGAGTELMEFMRRYAKEQGYRRIELNVWEFNRDAPAFYEAMGFCRLSAVYGNGRVTSGAAFASVVSCCLRHEIFLKTTAKPDAGKSKKVYHSVSGTVTVSGASRTPPVKKPDRPL